MTKKDYIKIAEILATYQRQMKMLCNVNPEYEWEGTLDHRFNSLNDDLCALFVEDNPRFDEDRFKSAVSGR